ncbi:MAG: PKD domain-containing protein, partial [Promethearchaeota archaeon]
SPHHIFQSDGFFNITLTIQDINEDLRKVSKLIFISKNFEPIASFSIFSNDYIIGQKIDFTFTGEEGNGPASFFWDFGDDTNSTLMNPNHTYKSLGNFSISLCVRDQNGDENMCFEQDFIEILLDFQPIANFTINQHSENLVEITFTGEIGNGPASFFWDFGDGTNSTLMNPNHTYTISGKFQIKLTIIDMDGDTSQLFKNIELGKSHALFQTLIFSIISVSFASGGIILFRKQRNKKTSIPLALLKI